MKKEKIDRINELSKKSKTSNLSVEEKAEQAALRREFIDEIKGEVRSHLENIEIVDEVEEMTDELVEEVEETEAEIEKKLN